MRDERFLVLGAGGYVGCCVVDELSALGVEVIALDRFLLLPAATAVGPGVTALIKDARNLEVSDFADIDVVIDLAALPNDAVGDRYPTQTFEINAAARIRNAALARRAGVRLFLLGSTASVYGAGHDHACHEESTLNPLTAYAKAGAIAEAALRDLSSGTFRTLALRQATLFGLSRRMRLDVAINAMVLRGCRRSEIVVDGDGSQWRPFLAVSEVAKLYASLSTRMLDDPKLDPVTLNVGAAAGSIQIAELARRLARVFSDRDHPIDVVNAGRTDARSYAMDYRRLLSIVGALPPFKLEHEVAAMIDAFYGGEIGSEQLTLEAYESLEASGLDI